MSIRRSNGVKTECPLIPMGAITGKPDRAFLTGTLEKWYSAGVTQFMIYPRSGCELEYLSLEYMDVCRWICVEAERIGFTSIWLYDEFNWPSGRCNGKVMQEDPDFAVKMLNVSRNEQGKLEYAVVSGSRMSDVFNPEAAKSFIRNTHEVYEKYLGDFFGRLIKGFFMDEPNISFFEPDVPENSSLTLPYYNGLPEDYCRLTGRSLYEDISCAIDSGSTFYEKVCNKLYAAGFRENFIGVISEWCRKRGLKLTGHLMDESSSAGALRRNGHLLEVLSAFSLPGVDDIFTPQNAAQVEWLTLSSAMYAAGKNSSGALAELFALGPCDMGFERIIRQIWLCAAFGIDHYVTAVSPLTAQGNALKINYFNPFCPMQPHFEYFAELGQHAARAAHFAGKKRITRIAVRYGYEPRYLADLLRYLAENQYSWELVMPDEKSDLPVVLDMRHDGIYDEKSGYFFADFACLDYYFLRDFKRETAVLEKDGTLAGSLFLREYADGTVLIINLSGFDRELVLQTPQGKTDIRLYRRGVYISEDIPSEVLPERGKVSAENEVILLDSPFVVRSDFEDGVSSFTLTGDMDDLVLAVRKHPDAVQIAIDGEPVTFSGAEPELPPGFRELYSCSTVLKLTAGKHELHLLNSAGEYPYLPAAFLLGRFSATADKVLSPVEGNVKNFYGYSGKITREMTAVIPEMCRRICAPDQKSGGELFIDGQSLGCCLIPPFEWDIPEIFRGKTVTLRCEYRVSCGQLFGEKIFRAPGANPLLRQFAPDNRNPFVLPELFWC